MRYVREVIAVGTIGSALVAGWGILGKVQHMLHLVGGEAVHLDIYRLIGAPGGSSIIGLAFIAGALSLGSAALGACLWAGLRRNAE